ncbi:ABC transporter permease [Gryllotalpicola ginsengisoli]|uniref:ABC transporter permease n=1 Tax=Gryllotalpicola ginsengisoli TaxID=444608 RepID=UPI0003B369E8|nr:ABC transporter permease [Gryllotalpicola ginsengisoli]
MTDTTGPQSGPDLRLTVSSLLRADFTVLTRTRQAILLNFLVPLVFIVATSLGQGNVLSDPGMLIGLAITYGLMSSGMLGYSIAVARDRDNGVFQRLRVTPTPTWAIMGSRIVVQVTVNLVMAIVVLIVGSALHQVVFEWWQYLSILGVSLLGATVFLGLGQTIVGLLRSSAAISGIGRVLYILLLLSGILGSTGLLGSGFKTFSEWTPVGALVNLYAAALGGGFTTDTLIGLCASIGYALIFAVIGIRWFRWESH